MRRAALDEVAEPTLADLPELVHENGFLAARDGMESKLLVPGSGSVPARELLDAMVVDLAPHAEALGCAEELADASRLAAATGAARQREHADGPDGIRGVAAWLAERFVAALPAS